MGGGRGREETETEVLSIGLAPGAVGGMFARRRYRARNGPGHVSLWRTIHLVRDRDGFRQTLDRFI